MAGPTKYLFLLSLARERGSCKGPNGKHKNLQAYHPASLNVEDLTNRIRDRIEQIGWY